MSVAKQPTDETESRSSDVSFCMAFDQLTGHVSSIVLFCYSLNQYFEQQPRDGRIKTIEKIQETIFKSQSRSRKDV